MEGTDKQDLRNAWRRRQQLNRRHGGRVRGAGGRGGDGRGQPNTRSSERRLVPEQRDRYGDDPSTSSGDEHGGREDYAVWLSTCPKDSQEVLRRRRLSLPDVHEYTRFVLETRDLESLDGVSDDEDASLNLEGIGACLRELPTDVILGTRPRAVEFDLVRRVVAEDPFLVGEMGVADVKREDFEERKPRVEVEGRDGAALVSLAEELDAFLLDNSALAANDDNRNTTKSTLEDDLAWFDDL